MPNIGITQADQTIAPTAGREMELALTGGATISGGVLPVIFDAPQEPDQWVEQTNALSFITANEYAIRRIVGKCFCAVQGELKTTSTANLQAETPLVLVTSGLFIARAGDEEGAPDTNDLPIGWSSQGNVSYNPDIPNCIREPWIWRRQWILGNPVMTQMLWQNLTVFPTGSNSIHDSLAWNMPHANWMLGSVADGPHFDAKTRRRVGNDDRLWWTVFAQPYPRLLGGYTNTVQVHARIDLRVFGAMRKARQRGAF